MRRFFGTFLIVLSIAALVFLVNLVVFLSTPTGQAATVVISPGMTLDQALGELVKAGVLSNRPLFKFYVIASGQGAKVRAGEYQFSEEMTPRELLQLLRKGDFARLRVTIPEGWTAREIADHLGKMELVTPSLFLEKVNPPAEDPGLGFPVSTLEGFLFPDTYEIYRPKGPEEVIRRMVEEFKEVYQEESRSRTAEIPLGPYEVVILASLVEKETGQKEERPLVASVFLNRLALGMPLQSDPSVIYGIPDFSGNLTRADLERPGSYNTYLNPGLPPTPIANPGRESIRAVFNPTPTDFLYFVSKNDGSHEFSRTSEEHQRAVYRYQILKGRP